MAVAAMSKRKHLAAIPGGRVKTPSLNYVGIKGIHNRWKYHRALKQKNKKMEDITWWLTALRMSTWEISVGNSQTNWKDYKEVETLQWVEKYT